MRDDLKQSHDVLRRDVVAHDRVVFERLARNAPRRRVEAHRLFEDLAGPHEFRQIRERRRARERVDFLLQTPHRLRMTSEFPPTPCERGPDGVVPRDEKRDRFVDQLEIGQPSSVVRIARLEQATK
jgi:hypothetical protein